MKTVSARSIVLYSCIAWAGLSQAQSPCKAIERHRQTFAESPALDVALSSRAALLQRMEYHFTPLEDGAFSAPNRSQELRSRVGAEGLEVFPRSVGADGEGAPWRMRLATKSFGRMGQTIELERPLVSVHEDRAELDHGLLLEWFENREQGIEQGWTIPWRATGAGPLWIGLELTGDLALCIEEGARSGALVDASCETVLHYRGLKAFDAAGRELDARLSSGPQGLGIEVEDLGAVYPLTVDPVVTGPVWTTESNQASSEYAWSVASAGDVNGDGYGDVIVGAYMYDNGQTNEGRAFVYHGSASGLSTSPAWTVESDQADARLGMSVASAGDVNDDGYDDVIVGTHFFTNGQTNEGRASVYHGSASGLSTSAAWSVESDQASAHLGASVSSAGDVDDDGYSDVIVGANDYDNGEGDEGRAFVYLGSAGGLATSAAWTSECDQASASFGKSVATAGDVNWDGYDDVVVGALFYDNGESAEGRAFVYLGSASGLATTAAWTAEANQANATFGWSVSSAGDVNGDGYADVIIGAPLYSNGETGEGRAFLYHGSASGLSPSADWTVEGNQANFFIGGLGKSVGTAGDVNGDSYGDVIVGFPTFDNVEVNEGQVLVYLGSAAGLATTPAWMAESNQAGANLGISVGTAGDVNGDGYSDVITGADLFSNGQSGEGRAFAYFGSPLGKGPWPRRVSENITPVEWPH